MQLIGLLAVVAALANPVLPATTANSDSPVSVSNCSVISTVVPQSSDAAMYQTIASEVNIDFANTSGRAIKSVTFDVAENGGVAEIQDVGHFAPGAKIAHYFPQGLLPDNGPTNCRVASVEYEDGTTTM